MNELEKTKPLLLEKKTSLTKGQKSLYNLICKKTNNGEILTYEESKEIYISNVCRCVIDSVVHHYSCTCEKDKLGHYIYELRPTPDNWVKVTVVHWLMGAIGALVLKGYLKVLPTIDLEDKSL